MNELSSISSCELLLSAIARGSHVALKRLYELQSRRLYGIALRIVRHPAAAADVLQDSFVQVWQNAGAFVPEKGSAAGWLTGIVRFRALDAARKAGREVLSDDPGLGDTAVESDPAAEIDAKVQSEALRRCLQKLENNQQRCIVLAFVEGYSHTQIAARLAVPLGSVKSWVRRGLVALKGCLQS